MRTKLPDARLSPRFSGHVTFGRYPRMEDVEPAALPVDWCIYGVPYDSGVTYRPGARFGPRAIREASQYLKRYHLEHEIDLCETFSLADGGDTPIRPFSPIEMMETARVFAEGLGDRERTKLLALGGDHSIAYANIMATWKRRGSPKGGLAVIHFDSHLDTVPEVWGEKYSHASPFIRAIEDGAIDPNRMISIGIKGPLNSKHDLDFAREQGVTIFTHDQWRVEGDAFARAFVRRLEGREAYVSFDIDCVDPVFAPGTGTPCPGGFTSDEVLVLIRALAGLNVVGADVVEVLPDRDHADVTSMLAAHVAFEIMCLDAVRPKVEAMNEARDGR